jgi:hypothetical protein
MALDEAGHRLFVGRRQPAKLLVFDTESGKEVAGVECSGDTDDVFFDAGSKRVFVSCGAGVLDVFEASKVAPQARSQDRDHGGCPDMSFCPRHRKAASRGPSPGEPAG